MKRFRFSLSTVLEVRRRNEEAAQRALAVAQGRRDAALKVLGTHEGSLHMLLGEHALAREKAVDLGLEAWFSARLNGLSRSIVEAKAELVAREADVEAGRVKAVEASRERLVLERLEERQRREHLFLLDREEQGQMDDRAQRSVSAFSLAADSNSGR